MAAELSVWGPANISPPESGSLASFGQSSVRTAEIRAPPFGIRTCSAAFDPSRNLRRTVIELINVSTVKRTAAVIFSHGLGDSSAGWSSSPEQLGSSCPGSTGSHKTYAPLQPVTLTWEQRCNRGGAISILTGLMSPSPLAGVACLSGFLTLKDKIKQLNVFWGHGTSDPWFSKKIKQHPINFSSASI
ncbi:hypothetical protein H4Q26_016348 [Puccinia striiformis f. sp. tritici PST-130]|nr:hypothetical protein H4Q26_016348 [Puccinia striiformis f. sp. tritici PST-130]